MCGANCVLCLCINHVKQLVRVTGVGVSVVLKHEAVVWLRFWITVPILKRQLGISRKSNVINIIG